MEQKLIELVKLRGRLIKFEIVELKDDKYCQLVMMLFSNEYYIIETTLDNHIDKCHYEDGHKFKWESEATHKFEFIINDRKINPS